MPLSIPPSHPPGLALNSHLYYHSTTWTNALNADIDALLTTFTTQTAVLPLYASSIPGMDGPGAQATPWSVFREVWKALGWEKIHLVGMLDGPPRKPWGESILRGLLEHAKAEPMRQLGAVFAIYAFWASQPATMDQTFVKIDPPTLEDFLLLPTILGSRSSAAPGVAGPSSISSSTPAADDATAVLCALISGKAFHLIPTETFLHPQIPIAWLDEESVIRKREEELRNDEFSALSDAASFLDKRKYPTITGAADSQSGDISESSEYARLKRGVLDDDDEDGAAAEGSPEAEKKAFKRRMLEVAKNHQRDTLSRLTVGNLPPLSNEEQSGDVQVGGSVAPQALSAYVGNGTT